MHRITAQCTMVCTIIIVHLFTAQDLRLHLLEENNNMFDMFQLRNLKTSVKCIYIVISEHPFLGQNHLRAKHNLKYHLLLQNDMFNY